MQLLYLLTIFVAVILANPVPIGQEVETQALKMRPNPDANAACERRQHFGYDMVVVHGRGWGIDTKTNETLTDHTYKQFKGCGVMTKFHFTPYPPGQGVRMTDTSRGNHRGEKFFIEWGAGFTLPLGMTSNCIGRAIASSGGPETKCKAWGKS